MTKINQEEYEFLKALDDKWEWIARDEDLSVYDDKPVKVHSAIPCWDISTEKNEWQRINRSLFQFIQWEDEEPYNITELIEEYENWVEDYEVDWDKVFGRESGETEVKDIEELKSWFEDDKLYLGGYVKCKISQLDEPEVLSQEWISENKFEVNGWNEAVHVEDLQNLLVPKQEKVNRAYKDGYERGKEHTFYKGYLEGLADKESINPERSPEVDRHKELLDELNDLYARKNQDYGNSFDESLDEDGLLVLKIRLGDKYKRFSQLINQKNEVVDESMRDTLIDLANYALMGVMWMDKNEEEE